MGEVCRSVNKNAIHHHEIKENDEWADKANIKRSRTKADAGPDAGDVGAEDNVIMLEYS